MLFRLTSLTRSQLSSVSTRTADFDDPDIVVQHVVKAGEAKVKASLPVTL
jgi:hypothetical protein